MAPGVFDFDDEAVPVAPAPALDEATPEEPEEVGDGGISDADRLVRLWLEDTRIVKVRLSPVWFHRITGRDTLESHFRQAMMLSTLHLPALPDDPDDEAGEDFVDSTDPDALPADVQRVFNQLTALGPRTLAAFEQVIADLDARYAAAEERASEPRPVAPAVTGSVRGATVTLDANGYAVDVAFDQAWLDGAQVGQICAAVQAAADKAYERFEPATVEPSELDALSEERAVVMAAFRAMLNPRRDR